MLNTVIEKIWKSRKEVIRTTNAEDERFARNILFWSLAIWSVYWFILPLLIIPGEYFDVLENIEWGRYWQFGYDKHPFVSMWITRAFYNLTGGTWVTYLLNQISISCAVICVWLLAKKIVTPLPALAAALMTLTLQYYSSWALEFNNDVIAISIWGATALFFYNALERQRILDWLLTAFFCAVALMTKYYAIVMIFSMAAVVLGHRKGRVSFRRSGIYWAIGLFLFLIFPNVIFLFQNDFLPFQYASKSSVASEHEGFWVSRFMNEFDLIGVILGRLGFFIGVYLCLFFHSHPQKLRPVSFHRFFMIVVGLGPLILTLLFPFLSGGRIKATWLASCFSLLALILFMHFRPEVTRRKIFILLAAIGVFGLALGGEIAFSKGIKLSYFKRGCGYEAFPGKELGREVTQLWQNRYKTPLKYVISGRKEGCNVSYFAADKPSAYYYADNRISPWVAPDDVLRFGAIIVWEIDDPEEEGDLPNYIQDMGELQDEIICLKPIVLERATNAWARFIMQRPPKSVTIGVAILPPYDAVETIAK